MRAIEHTVTEPSAPRPAGRPGGPGPSKLHYRLSRAWAKPIVRNAICVYLPLAILGIAGWRIAADDGIRQATQARLAEVVDRLAERPEFAVRGLSVSGASPGLKSAVQRAVGLEPGISSLRLDLEAIRYSVEALGAVKGARVQLDPQGMLRVAVTERVAQALWRGPQGRLMLVDGEGVAIGQVAQRAARPELVLLIGEGAGARVAEALRLVAAAPALLPRMRALVRVGERRWDLVLSRDLIVMLPEEDAVGALARVMALQSGSELLERDLAAVDMRLPDRPTLRMTPRAVELYRLRQVTAAERGQET